MIHYAICLAVLVAGAYAQCDDEAGTAVSSDGLKSAGVETCGGLWTLSNSDAASKCLGIHEAKEKCPCTCEEIEKGTTKPGPETTGAGTDAPTDAPTTGGGDDNGDGDGDEGKDGDDGDKKGGKCFHGDVEVMTESGSMKLKDLAGRYDLKIQSMSADNKAQFSAVTFWIHADPKVEALFYDISLASGHKLAASSMHILYTTPCNQPGQRIVTFAKDVAAGECMLVQQDGEMVVSQVESVTSEYKHGIYTVVTEDGNLIVNGVGASCFTSTKQEEFLNRFFWVGHMMKSALPSGVSDLIFGHAGDEIELPYILGTLVKLGSMIFHS